MLWEKTKNGLYSLTVGKSRVRQPLSHTGSYLRIVMKNILLILSAFIAVALQAQLAGPSDGGNTDTTNLAANVTVQPAPVLNQFQIVAQGGNFNSMVKYQE